MTKTLEYRNQMFSPNQRIKKVFFKTYLGIFKRDFIAAISLLVGIIQAL